MKENKKGKAVSLKYLGYDFIRVSASPGLLFFRPKKIYLTEKAKKEQPKEGVLYISNHISLFDPMYLMLGIWKRRHHFVAMQDLFKGKFKHWLFTKIFLCIKIDRDNFSFSTLNEIANHLKAGEAVTMFPEGHVNVNKEGTNAFKSGMIVMALRSGCPIVHVYIKRRPHWYSRLVLAVGEPININDFCKDRKPNVEDVKNATIYLQEQEEKLEALCK